MPDRRQPDGCTWPAASTTFTPRSSAAPTPGRPQPGPSGPLSCRRRKLRVEGGVSICPGRRYPFLDHLPTIRERSPAGRIWIVVWLSAPADRHHQTARRSSRPDLRSDRHDGGASNRAKVVQGTRSHLSRGPYQPVPWCAASRHLLAQTAAGRAPAMPLTPSPALTYLQ
jgi:hypothetical protein